MALQDSKRGQYPEFPLSSIFPWGPFIYYVSTHWGQGCYKMAISAYFQY